MGSGDEEMEVNLSGAMKSVVNDGNAKEDIEVNQGQKKEVDGVKGGFYNCSKKEKVGMPGRQETQNRLVAGCRSQKGCMAATQ